MTAIEVRRAGLRTTVQDGGRHHCAHLGVPAAGAVDRASMCAANVALGNPPHTALIESTLGGDELVADGEVRIAVRGAAVPVTVDGADADPEAVIVLRPGQRLRLGRVTSGVYVYVALAGGIAVEPVLGSRATDTLSSIGPAQLSAGDVLPVGEPHGTAPNANASGPLLMHSGALPVFPGPHLDLVSGSVLDALLATEWTVTPAADRVALRLSGPRIRPGIGGIDSEGLVPGAIQLPPEGQPVLFLANHPATGGYPVIAVLATHAIGAAAQSRPGATLSFAHADDGS